MGWTPNRQPIPSAQRRRILERDDHTCQMCHGRLCGNQALQIDHRVPIAEGGTNADPNLQVLGAYPCHKAKSEGERRRGLTRRSGHRPPERHPGLL